MSNFVIVVGRAWLCAAAIAVIPLEFTYAADPLKENTAERLLEERQQQERERQVRERSTKVEREVAPLPPGTQDDVCFDIDQISVEGNTVLPPAALSGAVSSYEGRCISKQMLNNIIAELTNQYVDAGYITARVYIPQQNLSDGELRLVVIEGSIEAIVLNDMSLGDRFKLWMAMPAKAGDVLQLRELEQGIDQFNRVQSSGAKLQLVPGEATGGTKVVIENEPDDEVRGFIGWDNDGSEGTGEDRVRIGFEYDNLLKANDSWSLIYIGSLDTNALAFNVGLPFQNWTFSYSHSYSEFLSVLTESSELFGISNVATLDVQRLIYRDSHKTMNVSTRITHRKSERFINDVALTPQRLAVARLGWSLSSRGAFTVLTDFGVTTGLDAFGADQDAADIPGDAPRAQFYKLDGSFTAIRRISDWVGSRFSLRGQYGFSPLFSSEQVHLGDSGTVRGYKGSPVSGDTGAYARQEFNFNFPLRWFSDEQRNLPWYYSTTLASLRCYLFTDYGWAYQRADETEGYLLGYGGGVRYTIKWLSFDLSYSSPWRAKPETLRDGASEVYLSATLKTF